MKKPAARVCFHISYSCALQTGMLEGSWCGITHLRGMDQACSPCPSMSPVDGLQAAFHFFWEAAAFAFKRKAGFWAQVESNSLPAVRWAVNLFVCALAAVFVVGVRYFNQSRIKQTQFTLDGCLHGFRAFPWARLSVSGVQWVQPWSLLCVLIQAQFVLLSLPSGKPFWKVPSQAKFFFSWHSLVLTWRTKTKQHSSLRTRIFLCPLVNNLVDNFN